MNDDNVCVGINYLTDSGYTDDLILEAWYDDHDQSNAIEPRPLIKEIDHSIYAWCDTIISEGQCEEASVFAGLLDKVAAQIKERSATLKDRIAEARHRNATETNEK